MVQVVGPRESVSQYRILARDSVSFQDLAPIVNIMAYRHFELMMLINPRLPRNVVRRRCSERWLGSLPNFVVPRRVRRITLI